jgi:RHS repeat-associated protein
VSADCSGSSCPASNTTTYYHGDQIGSSRLMTSGGGWPVWQGTFLPYGEEYNAQMGTNHYKFTGKERDSESGLDYFGARYYSNGLGRFITPDWAAKPAAVPYAVLGDPQTLNLYTYVRNIPTTNVDPDGHFADYYDQKGNLIRNDGVNDGKSYVVNGKTTVELPRAEFRAEVGAAADRMMNPTADDPTGHFHEDAVVEGHDKDGNLTDVRAEPGPVSDPSKSPDAHVDIEPAISKLADVTIDCHVHADGEKISERIAPNSGGVFNSGPAKTGESIEKKAFFNQEPSKGDKDGAGRKNWVHMQVSVKDNKVNFYNHGGTYATFPLDKFLQLK